jgi:ribose transport system permease protein
VKRLSISNLGLDKYSGLYVWALFIVVFGALTPNLFLTSGTFRSIAVTQSVTAMLGLAVVIPLAAGVFDLSVGANVQFCAVLVSMLQQRWGHGMWISILVTVAAGTLVGALNGLVVVCLKVSSFIATLGMATILAAFQTILTKNLDPLPETSAAWVNLTQRTFFGVQLIFWYLLAVAFILWWLLERMPVGRYIRAVGSNPDAARLSGVSVGRYWFISLVTCGAVTGIAGVCYASNVGPSLTFGNALLLPAYTAAFLGFTQIMPGRFNIVGALIAVYVLATGVQGLEYLTSVQWLSDMFNGITLIAAVSFAVWRQNARVNKKSAAPPTTTGDGGLAADDGQKVPTPA